MPDRRTFIRKGMAAVGSAALAGSLPRPSEAAFTPMPDPDFTEPAPLRGPVKNILWICTDQQRWDALGAAGNPAIDTPHLDKLAAEGVLFERAYCNNPVCMPSRASFLTGTYPSTVGLTTNGHQLSDDKLDWLITYQLNRCGYNCGLAGKLHIRGDSRNHASPESGYDHGYDEFQWSPCGFPANWAGCQYQHWLRDLGVPFTIQNHPETRHVQVGVDAKHHQTTWCAQRAITFMEAMGKTDQSWLFSCNIFDPHNPNDPPSDMLAKYEARIADLPPLNYEPGELGTKPANQRLHHASAVKRMPPEPLRFNDLTEREHQLYRASYYAMVELIDQQVGRVLDALEQSGQKDDTLVIFTSDHGESLGDHGLYWKGYWMYEESMRVPLILSWPGATPQKRRVSEFAELVDLVPTILDAIGAEKPSRIQGRSWWPFLTGGEPVDRPFAFAEMSGAEGKDIAMIRTDTHKLVRDYLTGEGELYDFSDPHLERVNHWNEPAYARTQEDLLKKLNARRTMVRGSTG